MMTDKEFINKLLKLVNEVETVYALGCWGQVMSENLIQSKARQLPRWYSSSKKNQLRQYIGKAFAFDCVCMIKSILWGFDFDYSKNNGGARYASNGVPDMGADTMINACSYVSRDFNNIVPGAVVWMSGHIGVYIGDGKVIECTPRWTNNVQITNLGNIGYRTGNFRNWTKWGKLKWITYSNTPSKVPVAPSKPSKPSDNTNYTTYTVRAGDSLWAIAAKVYGDGSKYTKLKELNGLTSDIIHTGQVLKVKETSIEADNIYTVKSGDCLWDIAQRELGNGSRYNEIKKLNNLTSNILLVGMKLRLPKR